MRRLLAFAGSLSLATILSAASASAAILDGGFEVQAPLEIGANPGYCYGSGGPPTCTGVDAPWEAVSGGGFQIETNSAWPGTETPDGSYYAFIQNGGSVNQQFVADTTGFF